MEKKHSVGLVVLTDIPGFDRVAVLQRRGVFNFETMQHEPWPGACQILVHGKCREFENPRDALFREAGEELGEQVPILIRLANPAVIHSDETESEFVTTYAALMDPNFLSMVRLHSSTGGITLLEEGLLYRVEDLPRVTIKVAGIITTTRIAMFPDEFEAVRKAFVHFKT